MSLGRSIYFRSRGIQDQEVGEPEIPDFAILFYFNVMNSKWVSDNGSVHGSNPDTPSGTDGYSSKIYRSYHYSTPSIPDVIANNAPSTAQNYLLRCVSSSTGWKTSCDISYTANISANTRFEPLLQTAGAHGSTTLLGRGSTNAPPLKNKGVQTNGPVTGPTGSIINKVAYYNSSSAGQHSHRIVGYVPDLLQTFKTTETKIPLPGTNLNESFTSIKIHPIIKDPTLPGSKRMKTLPKDVMVLYYGASGLNTTYFNPNDSQLRYPSTLQKHANTLTSPLSMVNNDAGAANYNGFPSDRDLLITVHQSNTSGFHDHAPTVSPTEYHSTKIANYSPVITSQAEEDPNYRISHSHSVGIIHRVRMISKRLKAYITKANNVELEDGIILGFSIGKHSNYVGPENGISALPANWYFCDGTNGTPDLRGYIPFANFEDSATGTVVNSVNNIQVESFYVEEVDWHHTHISSAVVVTDGDPGYQDVGSHNANYSVGSTTTKHTHTSAGLTSYNVVVGGVTTPRTNVKPVSSIYYYTPPCVDIAFIMYKAPL